MMQQAVHSAEHFLGSAAQSRAGVLTKSACYIDRCSRIAKETGACKRHCQKRPRRRFPAQPFMSAFDMDNATPPFDLAHASADIITALFRNMSLTDRFTCALVCKAWAEAATAATHSIILRDRIQDLSCLQRWLEKYGRRLEVLQLHSCDAGCLTALPCPRLQDLLLHGWDGFNIDSRVWDDIGAATKLTSVVLWYVQTASQQADVVSALAALPDLQQLTWWCMECDDEEVLSDNLFLKQMTKLTALQLEDVTAEALEHLGSLTKLQHLSITIAADWAAAVCPGLQELKALTRLELYNMTDIPASVNQLAALQQLSVSAATLTAVNGLQALTGLTQLCVLKVTGLSPESPPLQLPGLQHLELKGWGEVMPMSFLSRCTQLRVLSLHRLSFKGPDRLVASTMLQHLELKACGISAADGAASPVSWQQVFAAAGQLPHLTLLKLQPRRPTLEQADIECVAACCSSLQVLHLDTLHDSFPSAVARLSGLTSLHLYRANDQQCSSLAQLTGLRELKVDCPRQLSTAGLRQLAALEQLTSLGFESALDPNKISSSLQEQMSDKLLGYSHAIISKVRV